MPKLEHLDARRARVVCGAVQCVPRRMEDVERLLLGTTRSDDLARRAGSLAVRDAETLAHNGYKVSLVENLVSRAIRRARA